MSATKIMKLRDILPPDAEIAATRCGCRDRRDDRRQPCRSRPGDVFVAIAGSKTDGLRFVARRSPPARSAIVAERSRRCLVGHASGRGCRTASRSSASAMRGARWRLAAAKFYPRQPQTIAAVTGTSGKTSVAAFTRQIWSALGHRAASIGTDRHRFAARRNLWLADDARSGRAAPFARALAGDGVTHLAIEASSHGLDQYRLDGLRIAAGALHQHHAAIISTIIRASKPISPPSCGCSRRCSSRAARAVIDVDHDHADAVVAAAKARGLSILSVGRSGTGIRLVEATIDGFAQTPASRARR